jgi:hypothetical protein
MWRALGNVIQPVADSSTLLIAICNDQGNHLEGLEGSEVVLQPRNPFLGF